MKRLIGGFVVLLALLLGLAACGGASNEASKETTEETEAPAEPVYESFEDIQIQVNLNDHAFMKVDSYKDLNFTDHSGESESENGEMLTKEQKKELWKNIRWGENCSSEVTYQDFLYEDIIDIATIDVSGSENNTVDDYINFAKEMRSNYESSDDFTLNGVHASLVTYTGESGDTHEVVFVYKDRIYIIELVPIYSEEDELIEYIKSSIMFGEEDDSGVISWKDAGDHVGETIKLKGSIKNVTYSPESNGSPVFIDLGKAYPESGRVTIAIWEEDQNEFSVSPENMEDLYPIGAEITVTGEVEKYEDAFSIDVRNPRQIQKLNN